jgi:hypothetical protein
LSFWQEERIDKDKYGKLLEWHWQGKIEVLRRKISPCHFVHHKSQADWHEIEPGPPRTSLIHAQMFHEPGLVAHQEQPFTVKNNFLRTQRAPHRQRSQLWKAVRARY